MKTARAQSPTTITSWSTPAWADQITDDGDLIEAFKILGSIPGAPLQEHETLTVIIIQRDEITFVEGDFAIQRHPAEILVGGVSLSLAQARELADLITSAIALIAADHRPSGRAPSAPNAAPGRDHPL
jgi:hypothetical protein